MEPKSRETTAYVLLRDKYRRETARIGIAALEGTRQIAAEYLAKGLAAAYGLPARKLGTVSVIGPVRMDYPAAIATVREAAVQLSRYVEDVYEG